MYIKRLVYIWCLRKKSVSSHRKQEERYEYKILKVNYLFNFIRRDILFYLFFAFFKVWESWSDGEPSPSISLCVLNNDWMYWLNKGDIFITRQQEKL